MAKVSGSNGMSAVFKCQEKLSGDSYLDKDIQRLAGQRVEIERVEIRAMDYGKNLRLVILGKPVPLAYFKEYPPIDELREIAVVIAT